MRLPYLGLALLALPACFMPREAGEHMQADLLALRGEVGRLEQRIAADEAERRESQARDANALLAIERNLDAFRQAARQADADFGTQLESMLNDVQRLHGAIEENEHRLTETEARLQQELQTRLLALKESTKREEKEAPSSSVKNAAPRNKEELLRYGLELLGKGNKTDGRGVLRDVVRRFGKDKGVADEALFALGASALADGKHEAALRDLVRLVDRFPQNAHQAEAFFDIGACSEALGRLEDAKTFYTEVETNFANSASAKAARERLKAVAAALKRKAPAKADPPAAKSPSSRP